MDLVQQHEKTRLQSRKRRLEDEVAGLEAELCEEKAEVKSHLPKKYSPAKEMYKAPPLDISADAKEKEASGYKAPWTAEQCQVSMQVNGLYEASGLALWLRTGVYSTGASRDVNPGDVSFAALQKFEADFFSKDVALSCSILRGVKKQRQQKPRLLWPITMVCGVEAVSDVENRVCFDSCLNTAGCHFVIWSWYLAIFHALLKSDSWSASMLFSCLQTSTCLLYFIWGPSIHIFLVPKRSDQDKEWLDLLWEVGRSVSIQVRLCASEVDWALARNHASECLKSIKDSSLSSTFLDFARLVKALSIQQAADGNQHKLRFNSASYNASMHRAATGVLALISEGPAFEAAMSKLEPAYGRDLLSNAYSKLNRLHQIAKGAATAAQAASSAGSVHTPGKVATWLVGMLHLALRLGLTNASKATEAWLLGDRKHSTHGYWPACAVVLEAFDFLAPLKDKLPDAESKKCADALSRILDPDVCWTDFLQGQMPDCTTLVMQEEDEKLAAPAEETPELSKFEALKADFNKATGAMLELLMNLMQGKYMEDCKLLSQENTKLSHAVAEAAQAVQREEKGGEKKPLELIKCLCLIVKSFDTNTKSVSIANSLPAQSLIQTLTPSGSTEEDALGRERVWKQVQAERRKFVTFSVVPKLTKESLQSALRASGKVWSHSGQLNSSHRLIFASADLATEDGAEPWLQPSPPQAAQWNAVAEFAVSLTGPTDFCLLCDGRMREEDLVLSQTQTEEIFIIYSGGCVPRAGRMRRVPLSSRKVETASIRFPAQRSKLKTIKKENFTSCGEATTYQNTYSGVAFRPAAELPLISNSEKAKIFNAAAHAAPAAPEAWQDAHSDDVPLFWQEGKPISFYLAILDEFKVKTVFDMTAGSGALMEASITRGVQYHGLCLNREHMQWLQGVADRAACGLISIQGSTLHSDELAKSVRQYFADVLQNLIPTAADAGEEIVEPESDDGP
eukprot:s1151_g3.t1